MQQISKQTNKNSETQSIVWWLLEERRWVEVVKGKRDQIYGDGWSFDFGAEHTMQYIN